MDLSEAPQHVAFRAEVRAWLATNAPDPLPLDLEGTKDDLDHRRAWARRLRDAGYVAVDWPVEFGGAGLGVSERVIWNEEWARARAPETFQNTTDLLGSTLLARGTHVQRARYLPPMLVGDETWCQGFSEPDAGSDLAALATRAERDGGGRWRLTGQKVWTSHARWAQWCYVLARSSQEADRHRGITFFLVPLDQAGVEVRPLRQLSGDERFAEVFFDGAEAADMVGEIGEGWSVAMATLAHERFTRSFWLRMQLRNELDDLLGMIGSVTQPVLRQEVAAVESEIAILRWLLLRDLARQEAGLPLGAQGSMHKLAWSSVDQRLHDMGTRALGSRCVVGDGRFQRRFLYTRAESIFAGTSEIQRNILAERILGLPR